MTVQLQKTIPASAIAITVVDGARFAQLTPTLPAATRQWLQTVGFTGAPDSHALVPDAQGKLSQVFAGVPRADHPFALSALPTALPEGRYRLSDQGLVVPAEQAAMSWELGAYAFDLYKPRRRAAAQLLLASGPDAQRGIALATAMAATRDLVNTPAEHMGPEELAAAARMVAEQHGAKFRQVVGEALLKKNFPAIHAVGRASARAPRLIELTWGKARDPLLCLVGKGVCFDSGGLDIKGAEGMRQMKKDMGGAANALGLAALVMAFKLPVRLQVLLPTVENAIAGNAYRPGDVFKTRKGLHVEIGNTDAEGRVILCDALAYACEGKPALVIDLATLTGAARVALGPLNSTLPSTFSVTGDPRLNEINELRGFLC
jgi:leucyl aminopeptidase